MTVMMMMRRKKVGVPEPREDCENAPLLSCCCCDGVDVEGEEQAA